jgi:hypothetical protein
MSREVDQVFNDILVMLALEGDRQALDKLARRWWPRHYTQTKKRGHNRRGTTVISRGTTINI